MVDSSYPAVAGPGMEPYVTPGHPIAAGAGYDCACGECLSRRAWIDSGFSLDQVVAWSTAGYATPAAATEWTAIGIDDPTVVEQWCDAGFTPDSAASWVEIEDMTPSEAVTCANGGLCPTDVERIRRADPDRTLEPLDTETVEPDFGIEM